MSLAYCTTKNKITIMTTENYIDPLNCPYDWKKGYPEGVEIACGGKELPQKIAGKWYIYVWIKTLKMHQYYCFNEDLFYSDKYFEEHLRGL